MVLSSDYLWIFISCKLQASSFLSTANCQLSTANCQLPIANVSIKLRHWKSENERDAYTLEVNAGTPGSDTGTLGS
jgi:hypothetical protein